MKIIWHSTVAAVFIALLALTNLATAEQKCKSPLKAVLEPLETIVAEFLETVKYAKQPPKFHHIYSLDMTLPNQTCPDVLQLHNITTSNPSSLRTLCGRKGGPGCNSIKIPTYGKSYQDVCGKVRAYQFGSPDAFQSSGLAGNKLIDSNYVDGVSITHGSSPRKHIWTYAIGAVKYYRDRANYTCPSTGSGQAPPDFVGDNYFCSSGNAGKPARLAPILYHTPLWSNIRGNCSDCRDRDNELSFCIKLPKPTTDYLEVRVCTNQDIDLTTDEDIYIEYMDFYIR